MIETFDSMFAGHVDMGDVGYGGTAVNDRRFPKSTWQPFSRSRRPSPS